MNTKLSRGFTIVELLIVIVVIGILAALVLNTFNGVQQKARDDKRLTSVKAMATQLEVYYNTPGVSAYPDANPTPTASTLTQAFMTANLKGLDQNILTDPSHQSGNDWTNATGLVVGTSVPNAAIPTPSLANRTFVYVPYNGTGATAILCDASDAAHSNCQHFAIFSFTEFTGIAAVRACLN